MIVLVIHSVYNLIHLYFDI